eukprot:2410590-Amphidinium_carterae.1
MTVNGHNVMTALPADTCVIMAHSCQDVFFFRINEAFNLARGAESATTQAVPFAAVFLDCSKCYERVDLTLLEFRSRWTPGGETSEYGDRTTEIGATEPLDSPIWSNQVRASTVSSSSAALASTGCALVSEAGEKKRVRPSGATGCGATIPKLHVSSSCAFSACPL